jgi:hypothetical protein
LLDNQTIDISLEICLVFTNCIVRANLWLAMPRRAEDCAAISLVGFLAGLLSLLRLVLHCEMTATGQKETSERIENWQP